MRYTPAGSAVQVSAREALHGKVRGVEVEVADQGPGLAPDEMEKVFDLFYQGSRANETGQGGRKGYGIGLAICRAIAQVHGGRIWAENREGGGAVFHLFLPLPRPRAGRVDIPADDEAKEEDL